MPFYAVIDTNVIISSFLKADSNPNKIVKLALSGTIVPILNNEILIEYHDVLLRKKFGFEESTVNAFLQEFIKRSLYFGRTETSETFIDQDDVVFYEITLNARNAIDAYLITGNKVHFPSKTFIVSPKEMLDIIYKRF